MLPILKHYQCIDENSLQLTLVLSKELFWFKGHFPVQAIFPGVAQIDLVMKYAKQYLQVDSNLFKGVDVIKFQQPLFPDDIVTLAIELIKEKQLLTFQYKVKDVIASSGKITL